MLTVVDRNDRETSLIVVIVIALIVAIVGSRPAPQPAAAAQYSSAK